MSHTVTNPSPSRGRAAPRGRDRPSVAQLTGAAITAGRVRILDGVSLTLDSGEVVGLGGPNGAGKTTLLRVLATLHPIVRGVGHVLGAPLQTPTPREVRRSIAYLGHEPALHPSLSLRENLSLLTTAGRRQVDASLEVVGLGNAGDRVVARCSRGMVRRGEIARALLLRPRLLLLDEAHAGLDAGSVDLVQLLVDDVRERDGAAVVVSHDVDRLTPLTDRRLELGGGRVLEDPT